MKKLLIILVIIMLATPTIAFASPPPSADCSPGYWKNHTFWMADYSPEEAAAMLAGLQGGHDTRISRFEITNLLNSAYPEAACDD